MLQHRYVLTTVLKTMRDVLVREDRLLSRKAVVGPWLLNNFLG